MVELVASPLNRKRGHEINHLDDIVIRNYALDPPGEIRVLLPRVFDCVILLFFLQLSSLFTLVRFLNQMI